MVVLIQKYCKTYSKVCRFSSYSLKHLFEELMGCYLPHQEFKDAMGAAGFDTFCVFGDEHYYKIKNLDYPEIPIQWVTDKRKRYAKIQKRNRPSKTHA